MNTNQKIVVGIAGTVVALIVTGLVFVTGVAVGAVATGVEVVDQPAAEAPLAEDDPGWECDTMGNGICGPLVGEADRDGIVVLDGDSQPVLFLPWSEVVDVEYGGGAWVHSGDVWNTCIEAADVVAESDLPAGASPYLTSLCEAQLLYVTE